MQGPISGLVGEVPQAISGVRGVNAREVAIRICLAIMPNAVITVNGIQVDPMDYIESKETITFQSVTT